MTFIWEVIARYFGYNPSNVPDGYAFLYSGVTEVCARLSPAAHFFYTALGHCLP